MIVEYEEAQAPTGERAEQLAWGRRELLEVLTRHTPDQVCLRVAEGGQNQAASLLRAEMDGVVQATLGERGVPVRRFYSATVRSSFSAKTKAAADTAAAAIPCIAGSAKTRRDQVVVAFPAFPA
jgi:Holliday junction resolvasome RuvABC endonuclease subunit